jgi:hypothetical protein
MKMVESRFFWIKSNGEVEELEWEQYKKMAITQNMKPSYRRLLVKVESNHIAFDYAGHFIYVPRKPLEQILKIVEAK